MNILVLTLLFLSSLTLAVGILYLQLTGIYHSFKAHFGYGLVAIFLTPFALAVGAIKFFTGENVLLRNKKGKGRAA